MRCMANVLVIDDEQTIIRLLSAFLTDEGHRVWTAANGQAGLMSLERGPRPDVVLLDLRMPVLPGRAVIEAMRRRRDWREIPIIVLTAQAPDSDEMPPLGSYDALVQKPFDLDCLSGLINRLTRAAGTAIVSAPAGEAAGTCQG